MEINQISNERTRKLFSESENTPGDEFYRVNLKLANISVAYDYIVNTLPSNEHRMERTAIKDAADLVIAYDIETARNIIKYVLSSSI